MKEKPDYIQSSLWEAGSRSRISALRKLLTITNTQVAVKYRQNVGSLSIDMSADNRTTTLGRHIDRHIGRVSVDISTDAWPICRPIYRATHLGRHIGRHSTNMSTDISVDTRPICRPIRRSTVGRYVDRYVGRGVHKIHMIQKMWLHYPHQMKGKIPIVKLTWQEWLISSVLLDQSWWNFPPHETLKMRWQG